MTSILSQVSSQRPYHISQNQKILAQIERGWTMRDLKVGESYSGEELAEILDIENGGGDRLAAFGNDDQIVVTQDEGNDNYEVLAILDMPKLYKNIKG